MLEFEQKLEKEAISYGGSFQFTILTEFLIIFLPNIKKDFLNIKI